MEKEPQFTGINRLIAQFCFLVCVASLLTIGVMYISSFVPFFSNLLLCKQLPLNMFFGVGVLAVSSFVLEVVFYACHHIEDPEAFR